MRWIKHGRETATKEESSTIKSKQGEMRIEIETKDEELRQARDEKRKLANKIAVFEGQISETKMILA